MLHRIICSRPALAFGAVALTVLLFAAISTTRSDAATAPGLGTASSYAVLGGSTVTNTGSSIIDGDLGVWPGTAVTGFPPGIVTGGTIHAADANALQAQGDVTTAYNSLAAQPCDFDLTGQDLGGMTLIEGVYCFSAAAQLTGQLTLDAQGNASAVFIFQIGSTLTTASDASVLVINGGVACNAFWQVGSSATLGTTTAFVGNILALTSITANTGASISGRALARNGFVTLDTNNIDFLSCASATDTPSPTAAPTDTPSPTAAPTDTPAPTGPTPTITLTATPPGLTPTMTPTPSPSVPTFTPTEPTLTASASAIPTPMSPTPTPSLMLPPAAPTNTPSPTPMSPTPTPSLMPPPAAPTNTPSPAPAVPQLPNTGGPPAPGDGQWLVLSLGLALSGLGATVLAFVYYRVETEL